MSAGGARFVAIVDDEPAVLDSLKFFFEVAQYPVATYASAITFLEDTRSVHSCMILDHHMPQMTGLELAAQLKNERREIPILLMTAATSSTIVARAAEAGITRVIDKPPRENELLAFVETYHR